MGLTPTRFGPLHVFADAVHAARAHGVLSECALFEQILKPAAIERSTEDDGYCGAVLERPGLERVRGLAAEGRIDTVVVHAPDRA